MPISCQPPSRMTRYIFCLERKMRIITPLKNSSHGFTLVEIAIVMLIVGILLAGLIPTISSQIEQRQTSDTRKQLDEIQQALIGYAVVNGRLPCPASSTSNGVEDPLNTGICNHPNDGFLPSATLGLSNMDSSGFSIDGWGNRIRYSVTTAIANAYTTPSGMSSAGISALSNADLLVCATSTGITNTSCAPGTSLTANGVAVVIVSTGKDGINGAANPDEAANMHGATTKTFVTHDSTPTFDDLVVWISPNVLINRMVAAGKLP